MKEEIWKTIPGFSRYKVSNLGKIISTNYKNSGLTKELRPGYRGGYFRTMLLSDEGHYKTMSIHRIVMTTFFGHSQLEINHINGIKDDNRLCNLEYVTHSENLLHAYKTGLQFALNGEKNANSKLTEFEVEEIREYVKTLQESGKRYYNRKELAKKYNVSESCIKELIINRKTRKNCWSHL